jgi:flagellar assembly protein FliH
MTPNDTGTEVLRGMHIEPVPLSLRRRAAVQSIASQPADAQTAVRAEEAALRQRYEEAERAGHEQGTRAGYEAGLRKGMAAAAAQADAAVEKAVAQATDDLRGQHRTLSSLAQALQRSANAALLAAEDEMVALCFETICRVVGAAAAQPDLVRDHLRSLAASAAGGGPVAMHVHPGDAAQLANLDEAEAPTPRIDWIADPAVRHGGCLVRAKRGGLDARLETMLSACRQSLLAVRAQRSGDEDA